MKPCLISVPCSIPNGRDGSFFYNFVLGNPDCFTSGKVKRIDKDGKDHSVENLLEILEKQKTDTIKLEGCEENQFVMDVGFHIYMVIGEQLPQKRFLTAHMFKASQGAPSFPNHTDPTDIVVWCMSGTKVMIVEEQRYEIPAGYGLFMPANIVHRAQNEYDSVMISFGFELNNGKDCLPQNYRSMQS